uniref:flagellar biosynthesis anti-sigma factor FlgM n=1 Tax=Thaumasiovibrio occultus TaxID=1891184 RepID=UPI000B34C38D|nr:flagellar biosynthesis anti-sigma factor FlgM [Thaumasiovibrio occultus]
MASIDQLRGGPNIATTRSNSERVTSAKSDNASTVSTPRAPQSDAVSLSDQGRSVGQMHQQLAAEPSFDEAKVASIKAAIANGSYTIDADRLASNMLRFEDELRGL